VVQRIIEAGRLESVSLFARFGFTRDELWSAAARWAEAKRQGPAAKPSEVRTYVHELMHYVQYVTTPYGLFLQYCRVLQNRATIGIVKALIDAGCPVRQPLLYNLPPMPPAVMEEVERGLSLWLNVEDLVTALGGERAGRAALYEWFVADIERVERDDNPLRPALLGLPETFVRVQDSLASLIADSNAAAREKGNPVPMFPDNIDGSAIDAALSALPSDLDRSFEGSNLLFDLVGAASGSPFEVEAIIESSATAAEFWESNLSYSAFTAWATSATAPELRAYRAPLSLGLDAISTRHLPTFLASFMALCEVALFAPLLPQHAALRASSPGFDQLLPRVRFANLLSAAGRVEPMRDPADHGRYVIDLCRDLGWVQPLQIYASAANGPHDVSDPLAYLYVQAQLWRAQVSSATFIGIDRFLFDPSPAADRWRELFDFVIVDYADRTTYQRDKDFLQSMTTRYLNMQGLRAIMLGDSLALAAPYGNSPVENQWMTDWLRTRFASLFGQDFPNLCFR
jgi:hypothetical protein